jgi:hypothetical protein
MLIEPLPATQLSEAVDLWHEAGLTRSSASRCTPTLAGGATARR